MKQIVDSFYNAIKSGDNEMLWSLIHDDFTLLCPTRDHILSGMYQGKLRFFEEVLPQVFSCVDPEQIVFCNFNGSSSNKLPIFCVDFLLSCNLVQG